MNELYRKQFRSRLPLRGPRGHGAADGRGRHSAGAWNQKATEDRPSADIKTAVAPADVAARMADFLADKEGKQAHDFPAWNDYREVVGDTPIRAGSLRRCSRPSREFCAAIGGEPKRLAALLVERVKRLKERPVAIREGNRLVGLKPNMGNVATIILVAGRRDMAALVDEQLIYRLLETAGIVVEIVPERNGFQLKDWPS